MTCNGNQAAMKAPCDAMACQELDCKDCIRVRRHAALRKKCDVCYACPCDPEGHRSRRGTS